MGYKPIRSRWADFITAYKAGHILVPLGNGVLRKPERLKSWNQNVLDEYLMIDEDALATIPKYVFSESTKPIIRSAQTIETIELLKRFGRYRLPSQMCIAEFEADQSGVRMFVICYEKSERNIVSPIDSEFPFFTALFGLYDFSNPETQARLKTKSGRLVTDKFAVIYPIICEIENVGADRITDFDATEEEKKAGGVTYRASPTPWVQIHLDEATVDAPIDEKALTREFIVHGGFAIRALTAMMQTKGIAQEHVTVEDLKKLNKKRALNKKVGLIPAHTYVSLGHTYNKSGQRNPISTGQKQRFHLRSAHCKQQPYGPNNSLRKEIFVEAYLVNENPHETLVVPPRIVKP